jgi:hypothetical protein
VRSEGSIPHVSFVVLDLVSAEKRPKLILKSDPLVMLTLSLNILADRRSARTASLRRGSRSLVEKIR